MCEERERYKHKVHVYVHHISTCLYIPLENPAAILECLLLGNQSTHKHWQLSALDDVPIPYGTRTAATQVGMAKKGSFRVLSSSLFI